MLVPFRLFEFGVTQRPPPEALAPSGPALASATVCWLQLMHSGMGGGGASRIGGRVIDIWVNAGPYFQALKSKSTFCFCFGGKLSRLVDLGHAVMVLHHEKLLYCVSVSVSLCLLSFMSSLTWILGLFRSLSHFYDTRHNKASLAALLTLRCSFCMTVSTFNGCFYLCWPRVGIFCWCLSDVPKLPWAPEHHPGDPTSVAHFYH